MLLQPTILETTLHSCQNCKRLYSKKLLLFFQINADGDHEMWLYFCIGIWKSPPVSLVPSFWYRFSTVEYVMKIVHVDAVIIEATGWCQQQIHRLYKSMKKKASYCWKSHPVRLPRVDMNPYSSLGISFLCAQFTNQARSELRPSAIAIVLKPG